MFYISHSLAGLPRLPLCLARQRCSSKEQFGTVAWVGPMNHLFKHHPFSTGSLWGLANKPHQPRECQELGNVMLTGISLRIWEPNHKQLLEPKE